MYFGFFSIKRPDFIYIADTKKTDAFVFTSKKYCHEKVNNHIDHPGPDPDRMRK